MLLLVLMYELLDFLMHFLTILTLLQSLHYLLYLLCGLYLLAKLIHKEPVILLPLVSCRHPLFTYHTQFLHSFLSSLLLSFLLFPYFLFLFLLSLDLHLFSFFLLSSFLLYFISLPLLLFPLLLLDPLPFLLLHQLLLLDPRVVLVSQLHELDDSRSFLLHVLVSDLLVLFLHVSSLIPVSSFPHVILIVLTELTPSLEVVPILVKLIHLVQGSGIIT